MIEVKNRFVCPSCGRKSELMTFYSSYSKFYCDSCGDKLRLLDSKFYARVKIALQLACVPLLILGYLVFADKNDYLMKFAWLLGCLAVGLTIENFVTRFALKRSSVNKYES